MNSRSEVLLFKSISNNLAVQFSDEDTAERFLLKLAGNQIHCHDLMPVRQKNTLYFKAYITKSKQNNFLTAIFPSKEMNDNFYQLLIENQNATPNSIAIQRENNHKQSVLQFLDQAFFLPKGNISLSLPHEPEKEIELMLESENNKLPLPTFTATLIAENKMCWMGNIPISDHDPIFAKTAAGTLVSLNIWCPTSPIAGSLNPQGLTGKVKVLDAQQNETQMRLMAHYLFHLAKTGVAGFMLQEVPINHKYFAVLNNELQSLCHEHNLKDSEKLDLEFQNFHHTRTTKGGTCLLVNKNKLAVHDKTSSETRLHPDMQAGFGCYEIQMKNTPIKFDIYNVHGDGDKTKQPFVKNFVEQCVLNGAMVCGDFNLHSANQPKILLDSDYQQLTMGKLNTFDGFFDPYTPHFKSSQLQNHTTSIERTDQHEFHVDKNKSDAIRFAFTEELYKKGYHHLLDITPQGKSIIGHRSTTPVVSHFSILTFSIKETEDLYNHYDLYQTLALKNSILPATQKQAMTEPHAFKIDKIKANQIRSGFAAELHKKGYLDLIENTDYGPSVINHDLKTPKKSWVSDLTFSTSEVERLFDHYQLHGSLPFNITINTNNTTKSIINNNASSFFPTKNKLFIGSHPLICKEENGVVQFQFLTNNEAAYFHNKAKECLNETIIPQNELNMVRLSENQFKFICSKYPKQILFAYDKLPDAVTLTQLIANINQQIDKYLAQILYEESKVNNSYLFQPRPEKIKLWTAKMTVLISVKKLLRNETTPEDHKNIEMDPSHYGWNLGSKQAISLVNAAKKIKGIPLEWDEKPVLSPHKKTNG